MVQENLTKVELYQIASRLRGRREELAQRAGVTIWTVNNTFQGKWQNQTVLVEANKMIQEMKEAKQTSKVVEELRAALVSS